MEVQIFYHLTLFGMTLCFKIYKCKFGMEEFLLPGMEATCQFKKSVNETLAKYADLLVQENTLSQD